MAQCLIHPIIYEYDFSIHPAMGAWRYWGRHEIRVEGLTSAGNKYSLERRSKFFSLQGGGRLFGSNIAENGCCAKAQGISQR
jgi:hypothetical protein